MHSEDQKSSVSREMVPETGGPLKWILTYVAAARPDADDKTISYTLLNLAGKEAIERARTFAYGEGESVEKPKCLKQKFKELCEPRKKLTILRHRFNTRSQHPSE